MWVNKEYFAIICHAIIFKFLSLSHIQRLLSSLNLRIYFWYAKNRMATYMHAIAMWAWVESDGF